MAALDATMWAEGNASSCNQAATCLPLGEHRTWPKKYPHMIQNPMLVLRAPDAVRANLPRKDDMRLEY